MKFFQYFILILFTFFSINAKSQVILIEKVYDFDLKMIESLWTKNKVPQFIAPINFGVDVYKIIYQTKWIDDSQISASGLYYVPKSINPLPTLIYHHGTRVLKKRVNKIKGENIISMIFATDGYAVIAPDYIGLGDGEKEHLYCNVESEAIAAIDFLKVIDEVNKTINRKRNEKLFLTGYSQGGHATMSTHMVLERDYRDLYTVTASSPMSGPYDIYDTQSKVMYSSYEQPHYLPYLLIGLNTAYDIWPKKEFFSNFKSPYDTIIPRLFDGKNNIRKINQVLPKIPIQMLEDSLLIEYHRDPNFILHKYLQLNNIFDWKPEAPVQLCYCKSDQEVLYENSILAYNTMKKNGANNISLKSSGNKFNHQKCAGFATIYSKFYFDSYRKESKRLRKGPFFKRAALNLQKLLSTN